MKAAANRMILYTSSISMNNARMEISFWKWRWQNNAARYYFENVNFPAVLRSCSLLPFNWKELTFFTFWKVFACHCWRSHGELNVKWQQPIEVCSWQLSYQTKKSPFRGHFSFCGACTFTYSCHQFYHIIINLCAYCLSCTHTQQKKSYMVFKHKIQN